MDYLKNVHGRTVRIINLRTPPNPPKAGGGGMASLKFMSEIPEYKPAEPIFAVKPRSNFDKTYRRQTEYEEHLTPKLLKTLMVPLNQATGIDFFRKYEQIDKSAVESVAEIPEIAPFFEEQEGRKFKILTAESGRYLMMEEKLYMGKILTVFNLNNKPGLSSVPGNRAAPAEPVLKMLACYAVAEKEAELPEKGLDLLSFWADSSPIEQYTDSGESGVRTINAAADIARKYPDITSNHSDKLNVINDIARRNLKEGAKTEQPTGSLSDYLAEVVSVFKDKWNLSHGEGLKVQKAGIIRKDLKLDPAQVIDLARQSGTVIFQDQKGQEKWWQYVYLASTNSQSESDFSSGSIRSELLPGAIRMFMGETGPGENDLVMEFLKDANIRAEESGMPLRDILKLTEDVVKNRLAVAVHVIRKLHDYEIDLVSPEEMGKIPFLIKKTLNQVSNNESIITGLTAENLNAEREDGEIRSYHFNSLMEMIKNDPVFDVNFKEVWQDNNSLQHFEKIYRRLSAYEKDRFYLAIKNKISDIKYTISGRYKNANPDWIESPAFKRYYNIAGYVKNMELDYRINVLKWEKAEANSDPNVERWDQFVQYRNIKEYSKSKIQPGDDINPIGSINWRENESGKREAIVKDRDETEDNRQKKEMEEKLSKDEKIKRMLRGRFSEN